MKSLLSIVANSAKVKVWVIDKALINYIPESSQKYIFEQIVFSKDEDRPFHESDIHFITDQFIKWDKFKIDLVESIFERKYIEKFMQGL